MIDSPPDRGPGRVGWLGLVLFSAVAVLAALVEVFLLPLYLGSTIVPVSILLAVVSNVVVPLAGRSVYRSGTGAVLPFLAWLIVVLVLVMVPRPEGDVVVPGSGSVELVFWGTLIGGVVAGMVTITVSGRRELAQLVAERAEPRTVGASTSTRRPGARPGSGRPDPKGGGRPVKP